MDEQHQQVLVDEVAQVLAKCDGFEDPLPPHTERASRVFAYVLAPLLWLHAEAVWRLEMERLAHALTATARDAYETREGGEECSGRDDTGQASREDIAAKTLGRGLTTSGVPGPGDATATPAPLSSRPAPRAGT